MARINPEQLGKGLQSGLAPVYLVCGDEPLLVQEAADHIRSAARDQGFSERELYHTDSGFQWPQLLQSANSMSLFAERKLLELRLHSSKIGDAGSKTLQEYCKAPGEDNLLLLIAPKIERPVQNSAWFKALDATGVIVTVWPVKEQQLSRWIDQRLKKAGLRADSAAIDVLVNRIEGNLLAAIQEIEKLKLVAPEGVIDAAFMASAVVDSARYDIFGLIDKALLGNARAACASLNGLRGEGTEPIMVLWALAREIRTLITLKQLQSKGQNMDAAARQNGVFSQRVGLVKGALSRLRRAELEQLLQRCALIDRQIKGMARGQPWDELQDVVLGLCGQQVMA